ncbi:MAG: hypothetical protein K1X64_16490 [Myxococcaceae bacterium]|nr:hypothetical protein [Myxococcaceae bacterium]
MASGVYQPPDFTPLAAVPDARFAPAPANGVLPDGFFSTSNLPTFVKRNGRWSMPAAPRMDGVLVLRGSELITVEARAVRAGEQVAVAEHEDGSQGIFVHHGAFTSPGASGPGFRFMSTPVSREKPMQYAALAQALKTQRAHGGYLVWSFGPAVVHSRARQDVQWLIENGFVQAMLGGNAVAVHDLEAALFGTTLGMTEAGGTSDTGHGMHLRAINRIAQVGSIEAAVAQGLVTNGIMYALVKHRVPYVLAGSIRDDGPLPGVITDALAAQDAMRVHTQKATGAVLVATALHAIAIGNQLPAFYSTPHGSLHPLLTVCVDQTEFVVSKLKDRGTHQAYGVVTNAQDFLHVLRSYLSSP